MKQGCMEFSRSLVGVVVVVVVVAVNYQSIFFQSVFPKCIFSKFIFPKCIFPKCIFLKCISQNLFFQSVLIQSVFLQILPDLHVFQALRVYLIVFVLFFRCESISSLLVSKTFKFLCLCLWTCMERHGA